LALPELFGAEITEVLPASPAEKAGLIAGDIVRKIEETRIVDSRELVSEVSKLSPGSKVEFTVWRKEKNILLRVEIGAKPTLEEAFHIYLAAAKAGNVKSMFMVGKLYEGGEGTEKDYSKAAFWYLKGAQNGDAASQSMISYYYEKGIGVPQNSKKAAMHLIKSIKSGRKSSVRHLFKNPKIWSREFWRELQFSLKRSGAYQGIVDGRYGKNTQRAILSIFNLDNR
jgi:membrane-associated protease RseP (regulator of RpoE activity)